MQEIFNKKIEGHKTVYVFVDASNIWAAQKSNGKLLDYKKIQKKLKEIFNPKKLEIFYYSAYPADGTRNYDLDGRHKFFTFLKKGLGFKVIKKQLKRIRTENEIGEEGIKEKGDMDVEISIDIMSNINNYDTAVLFSGDSDFSIS